MIAPYVRREAVLSSRIEVTAASLSDLLSYEMEHPKHRTESADVREVRSYVTAMEHGLIRLKKFPLTLCLIQGIHAHLMKDVLGERATPGQFRRSQNWIGPPSSTIAISPYVPPPPAAMHDLPADWERFLHERDTFPGLIQCAIMHDQFEAIHP